ncbi:MAG: hypothetical protein EA424_18820 [Planctomycetaceae bacterium]|nr:MAG: hypothetical protein EA424_18820 [Planctomycetaceae bacterium]
MSAVRRPRKITPWHGPTRGFSFHREVQAVLDRNCLGCHNGQALRGRPLPDFRVDGPNGWRNFTPSYVALHPFVRRPSPESDYHLQRPLEFHVSTSELIQMLRKGQHGVQLDAEDWDRLITWIDLNVPDHGTWHEHRGSRSHWEQRRLAMRTAYAGRSEDPEAIVEVSSSVRQVSYQQPLEPPARTTRHVDCPNWPFDADEAKRRQAETGEAVRVIELPDGSRLELVLIPAGDFVMGCPDGKADEYPPHRVRIERPFYMGKFEISNAQFALFHPAYEPGSPIWPIRALPNSRCAIRHPGTPTAIALTTEPWSRSESAATSRMPGDCTTCTGTRPSGRVRCIARIHTRCVMGGTIRMPAGSESFVAVPGTLGLTVLEVRSGYRTTPGNPCIMSASAWFWSSNDTGSRIPPLEFTLHRDQLVMTKW